MASRERLARLIRNEAGGLVDDHGAGTEIRSIPGDHFIHGDSEADRQANLAQEVRGHGYISAVHRAIRISDARVPA
jgi:hypothetical protein